MPDDLTIHATGPAVWCNNCEVTVFGAVTRLVFVEQFGGPAASAIVTYPRFVVVLPTEVARALSGLVEQSAGMAVGPGVMGTMQ